MRVEALEHGPAEGNSLRSHTVERDAIRLRVQQWGGTAPPCLLLHGVGDNSQVWREFVRLWKPQRRVVATDFRGHGDSGWDPAGRYEVDDYVADVERVIEECGGGGVSLIGHSLGGDVALRVAARAPALVTHLVLVDFGPELNEAARKVAGSKLASSLHAFESVADYAAWLAMSRPLAKVPLLESYAEHCLRREERGFVPKMDPRVIRNEYALASDTLWLLLREIVCPVLIVRGQGSALLTRETVARVLRTASNSEAATIGMAGHSVMLENPQELAEAVRSFFARHAVSHD